MELKINLSDREDIAAGASLLQYLLTGSTCTGQGKCHDQRDPLPEHPNFGCVVRPIAADVAAYRDAHDVSMDAAKSALYEEFRAAQAADTRDPATVFGGAVVPAPLLVPSTAVAAPLPTAPVAPMPTLPQAVTAPVPPAPTPAVAAIVPTAPAAPSSLAGSVELDAKGLPWDARIHSSGKTLIKDGTWRYKGGVPPERIVAVEAELRGGPAPLAVPAAPIATIQVPAAPAGASLATTIVSPADAPQTFEQIMPRITAAVTAGKLQPGAIQAACSALGLASIVQLQTSPAFVPQVWALLGLEG